MRIIEEKEKPMTDEMKQRVIRVINELREYSMIDQHIEDWKRTMIWTVRSAGLCMSALR